MPRYANMSDAEAEAWERGGGAYHRSDAGTVYHPDQPAPVLDRRHAVPPHEAAPMPPGLTSPLADHPTDWQRTAPDREPLPDWPIEPVLEALQRERDQRRAEPIPLRVKVRELVEAEEARQTAIPKEPAPADRYVRNPELHGTLAAYLAGDRCLDCTNAANEAAMLGTYHP